MLTNRPLPVADSFYVLAAFLSSNLSVAITVLWLIPGLVFLEALWWLVLAMIAIWICRRNHLLSMLGTNMSRNWIILPFLAFAGLSISWSVLWQISLSRWLILVATLIVGGYIGIRCDLRRIVRLLAIFGVAILLVSAAIVLLAPRYGIMNYYIIQGAWKGFFWHKNHMGLIAAFFALVFLVAAVGAMQRRAKTVWLWGILYLLALVFTYETDSVAAYLVLIILHVALLLLLAYVKVRSSLRAAHYALLAAILILAIAGLYANRDRILGAFNRNSTLTGRVPMWGHLFDMYVSQRPVAGYGFNAFWYVESHRTTMQQGAGYPDPIVISDNGFLDILVNTGYSGLILFLVFYLGLWARSVGRAWRASDVYGLFPLIVMAYTLLANATWSLLYENESFFMLIMVALMFALSNEQVAGQSAYPLAS